MKFRVGSLLPKSYYTTRQPQNCWAEIGLYYQSFEYYSWQQMGFPSAVTSRAVKDTKTRPPPIGYYSHNFVHMVKTTVGKLGILSANLSGQITIIPKTELRAFLGRFRRCVLGLLFEIRERLFLGLKSLQVHRRLLRFRWPQRGLRLGSSRLVEWYHRIWTTDSDERLLDRQLGLQVPCSSTEGCAQQNSLLWAQKGLSSLLNQIFSAKSHHNFVCFFSNGTEVGVLEKKTDFQGLRPCVRFFVRSVLVKNY